ncbi:MAG: DJ-1/PfpI family protein [Sphingomonas sp.]|uniref:DJ-1/PfpI family protein n=1 Tax=Sphingomonas sp. TaxID=28214 RepID=UPI00180E0FC9|nr:DJ-1/PfpI family protein [Sphingomonas sp.]MBA3666645.1 DJ-1/PfpI family protein [Sphingomonas sp.]
MNIGIFLFDDVEELDAVGPYEVLTWAAGEREGFADVFTMAVTTDPVRCAKGMRIVPDYSLETAPPLDVLIVPGGVGTRELAQNAAVLDYVREQAARCRWVTSVCTGVRVLLAAGPAVGKRVTTHWGAIAEIRSSGLALEVLDDVRFVRDGNVVTAAGVSAGIDMALWLVGELGDPGFARAVQKGIEYFPAPPYSASV